MPIDIKIRIVKQNIIMMWNKFVVTHTIFVTKFNEMQNGEIGNGLGY